MLAFVVLYEILGAMYIEGFVFNWFEFIGTWCGTITVWLVRTKNIHNWPIGFVCGACFGYFFWSGGVIGQGVLNLLFFAPLSLWYWYEWATKTETSSQDLPIEFMTLPEIIVWLSVITLGTLAIWWNISAFAPWSSLPWVDSLVVASSIVAQILLGKRKPESWILWLGPVNMLSIYLFVSMGWYTAALLYVAFFFHAAWATATWWKEAEANADD
jgi:nicotinamide mononucleotide transporter